MKAPDHPITVGRITLPYSHMRKGWKHPDGTLIKNPLKAQRIAELLNNEKHN